MKTRVTYLAAAGLAALSSSPAIAAGTNVLQARATPIGFGNYEITVGSNSTDGDYLSSDLGFTFIHAKEDNSAWIADVELEFFQVETDIGGDFDRTDLKLSLGYKLPANITPFVGYRTANQGDGFADDEFAKETGFFLGASYSGIPVGEVGNLTFSLAYNFNEYEVNPNSSGFTFDTKGLSGKISFLLSAVPVAFNLKYQSFTEDEDIGGDYEETYTTILNATWYFWSGVMGQ